MRRFNLKKIIWIVCLLYIGCVALYLGYHGVVWGFMPQGKFAHFELIVPSTAAINVIKSLVGTCLLTMSIFSVLFIVNRKRWFLPMIIMTAVILVVRITSLAVDGYHTRMATLAFLEVLVLVDLLVVKHLEP